MAHTDFPTDEILAAFIDGRADPQTRKRVMEHIVGCDDCYATFEAATEMKNSAGRIVRFPKKRVALIGFAAAVAAALMVVLAPAIRERLRPHSGLAALAAAAPAHRTIEGRLTGFPYRPIAPVMRGAKEANPTTNPENAELLSIAGRIQEEANRNPTPENLHVLGVWHLLLGNLEIAVTNLEDALRKEMSEQKISAAINRSNDLALLNDLSVALAQRGDPTRNDFLLAEEAAERAWQLSQNPETAWNRAIALKREGLSKRAIDAWKDYLRLDSTSKWADEARVFLKVHASQSLLRDKRIPVDSNCRQRWQSAVDQLITTWAPAFVQRDSAEPYIKARLKGVGDDLQRSCSDSLVAEALRNHNIRKSADALNSLNKAISAEQRGGLVAAIDLFDRAERRATGSPVLIIVQTRRSTAAFQTQRFDDSIRWSTKALSTPDAPRFKIAAANANWMRGLSLFASGDLVSACRSYNQALTTFAAIGDNVSEARVSSLLASAEETLGAANEAWSLRARSINALSRSSRNDYTLFIFASAAANEGLFRTAGQVLAEYLADPHTEPANHLADAYCLRALVGSKIGASSFAADLTRARQITATIPSKAERERLRGYIALIRAMSSREIRDIDSALKYYTAGQSPFVISRLLFWRGIAERDKGALEEAENDFIRSILVIQRQGVSFRTIEDRAPLFGTTSDLFDAVIDAQIDRHEFERAFEFRERSYGLLVSDPRLPISLQAAANTTPDGTIRVEYAVLPTRLITWVVSPKSARTYITPVSSMALEDIVRIARKTRDYGARSSHLRRLSAMLLAHVPLNAQTRSITFIPDKSLTSVPFASLLVGDTFLVEHCSITLSTRMSGLDPQFDTAKRFDSVLALGNPRVPPSAASELSPLPAAEQEATEIASGFRTQTVLTGTAATIEKFRCLSSSADVVHFAGHAINDFKNPLNSSLVFASDTEDSLALLRARDLAELSFTRTALVTLSACSTGHGGGGTMSNIAQALLLAGVPNVIASQDDIADGTATRFFRAFYSNLHRGREVPKALRNAQLAFLRSNEPTLAKPSAWDTFVVFTVSG
ncbi:MAG TPA: CHAT domain-containing protein [Thermoanaerobaculia bacterium]|nr:CHAT domain-containing protein [Thermoanaerobaculia bacterium]